MGGSKTSKDSCNRLPVDDNANEENPTQEEETQNDSEEEDAVGNENHMCGNSVIEPGELCDDGNLNNGDGCD